VKERVLLIVAAPFVPWHGVSLRTRHTAMALAALGYQVDLLALAGGTLPEIPGVRIRRTGRVPFLSAVRKDGVSTWWVYRMLLVLRTLSMVVGVRYRFVHGVDGAWPSAWLAARICGAHLIYEHCEARAGEARTPRQRFIMKRAAAVITADRLVVSQMRSLGRESRACLISDTPGTWQEDEAIGSSIDIRDGMGVAPSVLVVTYVGSLRKHQGVDLLFNALPILRRDLPKFTMIIVGGTAQEISRAQGLLQKAGVDDAVIFTGQVPTDSLVAIMAASDILVAPRRHGWRAPIKVLDYMLAGKAIVATDCAANRNVLTDECALLVPGEAAAFARAITLLGRDTSRRLAMGKAARGHVLNEFSFGAFQEGLRRCYTYVDIKDSNR